MLEKYHALLASDAREAGAFYQQHADAIAAALGERNRKFLAEAKERETAWLKNR